MRSCLWPTVMYTSTDQGHAERGCKKAFEMLPATYEYQDESLRRSYHRGEVRGEAKSILNILDARGISVSEEEKNAIWECSDSAKLERMVRKALTVRSAAELFE